MQSKVPCDSVDTSSFIRTTSLRILHHITVEWAVVMEDAKHESKTDGMPPIHSTHTIGQKKATFKHHNQCFSVKMKPKVVANKKWIAIQMSNSETCSSSLVYKQANTAAEKKEARCIDAQIQEMLVHHSSVDVLFGKMKITF